ncbi:hypothetical protein LTR27_010226 [Elasticomyces elasticus]|nr:hypothetical protein LTR27_010226 [Elasticomyces elasticus]
MPKTTYSTKGRPQAQTVIRRPEAVDTFYSSKTSPKTWAEISEGTVNQRSRQRDLSHFGRIEETEAGEVAVDECEGCAKKELACKVYTEAARAQYHIGGSGQGCSRCRWSGGGCSHQRDADAARGGVKRKRTLADADAEIAALREELAAVKQESDELKTSLALYQEQCEGFDGFGSDGSDVEGENITIASRPKSTISYTSR